MDKANILYLTAYVPHRAAAGEKNTMLMLNDLADKFNVDLIYYKYDNEADYIPERDNVRVVKTMRNSPYIKLRNFAFYPFVHPTFSIRFDRKLLHQISNLIKERNYKAVVLNHSNMFIYGAYIDVDIPKIIISHDVIMQRAMRSSSRLVQKICYRSERKFLSQSNAHVFSLCQKDQDLISKLYHIPSNICLVYIDEKIKSKKPTKVDDYFVMMGDWTRNENSDGAIWFINNVGPLLKKTTEVRIIGRRFPTEHIKKSNNLKVNILGFVDDPYEIISQSKAMICPLFMGAGIKVKVIEALACGTPVIGTPIAFEGLPNEFSHVMLEVKEAEEYVEAMERVNTDIENRIRTKEDFLRAYEQVSISNYIDGLVNPTGCV